MPNLARRNAGDGVTDVWWNEIVDDLNSLTAVATGYNGKLGVGVLTPTRQLHVYGLGQSTPALTDAGNKNGTIYVQDAGGSPGNGGAVVFGGVTGHFGAIKSSLYDASGTTTGDLVVSLRRTISDTALTEVFRFGYGGSAYLNDSANQNMTLGLTLNQGANDDEILAFKSSDVSHAINTIAEPDTYGTIRKYNATSGGVAVSGFGESAVGAVINGYGTGTDGTHTSAGLAAVVINGAQWDAGTFITSLATNGNLCCFQNLGVTQAIITADGDGWQNGAGWTTYDGEDDIEVLNLLTAYATREDDPLKAAFGGWLAQSREPLERLKLAEFDSEGRPFVNMSKLTMLLTGAVRQLSGTVQAFSGRLQALEA